MCAYPTPQEGLVNKETSMLELLQLLQKAMGRARGAGVSLEEEGRSPGGGTMHSHPSLHFPREALFWITVS